MHVIPTKTPVACRLNGQGLSPMFQRLPRDLEQQPLLRVHLAASRGVMPKNCESNCSIPSTKPPQQWSGCPKHPVVDA